MLTLLLALSVAQPFPYNPFRAPIMSRQDGAALSSRPQYAIDCDSASMACTVDGGVLLLASMGGGGGPALADGGAPANATYITQTASSGLTNEQALSSLSTGVVKVTTGTGVLSTAVSGTDYAPATSGSTVLLGNGSGGFSSYAGTSCTNQFPRSLSTAGAATCASVALATDVSGTLAQARGGTGAGALTCAAGERLTSNGTAYSCSAVVTAAIDTVKDEGSSLAQRATVNFTGSGITCIDNAGSNRTDCDVPGGSSGGVSPLVLSFGGF